jgi:hypothetical protein
MRPDCPSVNQEALFSGQIFEKKSKMDDQKSEQRPEAKPSRKRPEIILSS